MRSSCRSAGGCEFRRAGDCPRQPKLSALTRALGLLVVLTSAPTVQALDATESDSRLRPGSMGRTSRAAVQHRPGHPPDAGRLPVAGHADRPRPIRWTELHAAFGSGHRIVHQLSVPISCWALESGPKSTGWRSNGPSPADWCSGSPIFPSIATSRSWREPRNGSELLPQRWFQSNSTRTPPMESVST